jgi:hypothetical protein
MKIIIVCIVAIFCSGCYSINNILNENGNNARISLSDKKIVEGEIIMVDSVNVYLKTPAITLIPFSSIDKLEVIAKKGKWSTPLILFQVIPSVLLTLAERSVSEGSTVLIPLLLITSTTYILFAASDSDDITFQGQDLFSNYSELKKYSKYPNGLSEYHFQMLQNMDTKTSTPVRARKKIHKGRSYY